MPNPVAARDSTSQTARLEAFENALAGVIGSAGSLGEIEAWLKSQQCITDVRVSDYLLKSNPPQRAIVIKMMITPGNTEMTKIVTIFDLGLKGFRLQKVRDQ